MKSKKYISGIDTDTGKFANALRRLADGVESGGIGITKTSTSTEVDSDELATFDLAIEYRASHEYSDVVDTISFATDAYLRFGNEYIRPILRGDKKTTVRYDLDKEFDPESEITLVDPDDDTFATATVEACVDLPVRRVCDFEIGSYESGDEAVQELVSGLRELYDTDDIHPDTYVTVVLFGGVQANSEYDIESHV